MEARAGSGPRCELATFSNFEGEHGNEAWLHPPRRARGLCPPQRTEILASEHVKSDEQPVEAGASRTGPETVSHPPLLQKALLRLLRKSTASLVNLDTQPPLPAQKLSLLSVGMSSNFCSKFIPLVCVGGQEGEAVVLTPQRAQRGHSPPPPTLGSQPPELPSSW